MHNFCRFIIWFFKNKALSQFSVFSDYFAYADSLYKIGYDPKNIEQAAMECLTEDVLAGVYRHQLIGQKTKYDVLKELAKTTVIGDKQAQEFAIDFERK